MQESDLKRRAPWEEIFFREAFFLYEHRAAVYADRKKKGGLCKCSGKKVNLRLAK